MTKTRALPQTPHQVRAPRATLSLRHKKSSSQRTLPLNFRLDNHGTFPRGNPRALFLCVLLSPVNLSVHLVVVFQDTHVWSYLESNISLSFTLQDSLRSVSCNPLPFTFFFLPIFIFWLAYPFAEIFEISLHVLLKSFSTSCNPIPLPSLSQRHLKSIFLQVPFLSSFLLSFLLRFPRLQSCPFATDKILSVKDFQPMTLCMYECLVTQTPCLHHRSQS